MIALLIAPGFEEVEVVTPADFLRRAGIDVKLVALRGTEVEGAHGISVKADLSLDQLSRDPDGLILPGGMPGAENLANSEQVLELIRRQNQAGNMIAAICASPAVVLTKAGVLSGKRVTCYPGFEERFSDCTFVDQRVVVDGNLITSRGPGTAAEFAVKLIEILKGKELAQEIHRATLQK